MSTIKKRCITQVPWRWLALERLEDRITPSEISLTGSPQSIPIGDPQPGQTVHLKVTFSTTDPDDQNEGEPIIITASDGYSQTVLSYGTQTVEIPITQEEETVSAYIQGYDGDETAIVQPPPVVNIVKIFTENSKSMSVKYKVLNNDDLAKFTINVYRSPNSNLWSSPFAASSPEIDKWAIRT